MSLPVILTALRKFAGCLSGDPFQVVFYSSLPQESFDVAVVDEFGVLSSLYEFGDLAYVGGSLVPKGGQNPVEPAAAGKPVLFGPDMSDFPDIADLMLKEGGAIQVKNGEELTAQVSRLLSDSALSARLGAKNKALVERTLRGDLEDRKGHPGMFIEGPEFL